MSLNLRNILLVGISIVVTTFTVQRTIAQSIPGDFLRDLQFKAIESQFAEWGHWGSNPKAFSQWTNHSNRLIPVYSFGIELKSISGENSCYRNKTELEKRFGFLPENSENKHAEYFDQVQLHDLQMQAVNSGKKYIFLVVFDGMDWQSSWAAAIYKNQEVSYTEGRGNGLHFQDYDGTTTDFGFMVTSPHNNGTKTDVDAQTVTNPGGNKRGGYSADLGGDNPWTSRHLPDYLLGTFRSKMHVVTDSASSATSMTSGIKTYNGAINVDFEGKKVEPIARYLQREKNFRVGVVTSVPISHATPAAAYSNNVTRDDYQDLTRDLIGLPSNSNREPLAGVDVLIGCGWGEFDKKGKKQGKNFEPGNKYISDNDLKAIDIASNGKYVVAVRTPEKNGARVLNEAAQDAADSNLRLFGFFGHKGGHLPYQTADGKYDPTRGKSKAERYDYADITENPTLAEMTKAALTVIEDTESGFWLMLEAGDVDWANHNNNIDDSIGAVFSGDAAVKEITDWIEKNDAWEQSAVIVTADHGHLFNIVDPTVFIRPQGKSALKTN